MRQKAWAEKECPGNARGKPVDANLAPLDFRKGKGQKRMGGFPMRGTPRSAQVEPKPASPARLGTVFFKNWPPSAPLPTIEDIGPFVFEVPPPLCKK
jgi:hypothetical protein